MGPDTSIYHEIQSAIDSVEKNEALGEEANFIARAEAIDFIEFHVIDRIGRINRAEDLTELKQRAESLKKRLEETDEALFRKTRANIGIGNYTRKDLWRQLDEYTERAAKARSREDMGYDALDMFVNGLLRIDVVPRETRKRSPDMVFFQPTPATIVLELIKKSNITQDDVFYDLGSGLGQVPILVNLLTGAKTKGVEFEPVYCDYARQCARSLRLGSVEFVNLDARDADYSDGTVFFMYTPFTGEMLQEVLDRLKDESRSRMIRICAYGPCTLPVSNQSWLRLIDQNGAQREYKLAVFESIANATGQRNHTVQDNSTEGVDT